MSIVVVSDSPRKFEFTLQSNLGCDLVKLENAVLDPYELSERVKGKIVLLRVYNMYKLVPVAFIVKRTAEQVINRAELVLSCICREVLYTVLSEKGLPVPRRYYVFDMCNVSDVRDKVRGKTLLLTFTKSEVEGFVETPQALVSVIEHRYYMSAEDVKVNLFIPQLTSYHEILVVGKDVIPCTQQIDIEVLQLVESVVNVLGDGIYLVRVGRQEDRPVILDVDPVPEIKEEHLEKVLSYLKAIARS